MKNNIPMIYWIFRYLWTLMHFVIIAAAAAALLTWALTDNHAIRIWETSKMNVLDVQYRVSNVIPWPWADDEEKDETGYTESGETLSIQVETEIHIRREPTPESESIQVLDAGSWVEANCKVEDGALVEREPTGSSSRWDHIPGLGYISDAYVSTYTDELPNC